MGQDSVYSTPVMLLGVVDNIVLCAVLRGRDGLYSWQKRASKLVLLACDWQFVMSHNLSLEKACNRRPNRDRKGP